MNAPAGLRWWMPPLLAVQFLTRVPVPGLSRLDAEIARAGLTHSLGWFPLVGGLIGAVTAAVLLAADSLWPPMVAAILALIVEARLTGGFHEDAVADFCDGFGGGRDAGHIHAIMKDSRIGTYGTLGLGLAVALRGALLISLPADLIAAALIASAGFGRFLAVCGMAFIPAYGDRGGLAKDIGGSVSPSLFALAAVLTLLCLTPLVVVRPLAVLAGLAAALLFMLWLRRFLLRRLGGATGDCLGFAAYAGQLILLLAAAAAG